MNKLLTIVIPTYNMQVYLHRCLDSLIVPDEQMAQLEVLVINDGSKDNSSAIAHEYETKYPSTFCVIDKENGNYGSCVNRGLAEASGKYIKVLDADDWFDTTEFSRYLKALQQVDVDMVLTPFKIYNEGTRDISLSTQPNIQEGIVMDFQTCSPAKLFRYSMHMITYRTSLLREMNYRQTEGISYTDTEWTHVPQYKVKTFEWFHNAVYCYRIGRIGQTMEASELSKNIWKYEVICRSLIENSKKYPQKKTCLLAEEFNIQQITFLAENIYHMFLVIERPAKEDAEHLKQLDSYLQDACHEAYYRVGLSPMKKWLPIRYVKIWRKTGVRLPLDTILKLYKRLRYGKKSVK